MTADAHQSATEKRQDVSEIRQFSGESPGSFWRHSPRRRQGRHPEYQERDRLAHNGYPRRTAESLDGVTFDSDEMSRPQRGANGTHGDSNNENEGESDVDCDANSFEYGTEYGASTKGKPNATVAPLPDRKRKLHEGGRVSMPTDKDGSGGYQNFGDTNTDKITLLERADRQLQSHSFEGSIRKLILESLRLEKESDGGLKRWNAHYEGKDGALVGWTAYYTTVERARQLAEELDVTVDVTLLERHANKFATSETLN